MEMKNKFFRSFPLLFWAFLIFLGSSLPPTKASPDSLIDFGVHKLVHLFEYGVLYLLYYYSLAPEFWQQNGKNLFQTFIFVIVFGAFDEYHQSFVKGRSSRVQDVFIDFLGAVLAYLIWRFSRQKMLRRQVN